MYRAFPALLALACAPGLESGGENARTLEPEPDRCVVPTGELHLDATYIDATFDRPTTLVPSCGDIGPSTIVHFTAPEDGKYIAEARGLDDLDVVLSQWTECEETEIACNDDGPEGRKHALIDFYAEAGETVLFVVGGAAQTTGKFTLDVWPKGCGPEIPGDGIDQDCDGADAFATCATTGPLTGQFHGLLQCDGAPDVWELPVVAGDCIDLFADNSLIGLADLSLVVTDGSAVSWGEATSPCSADGTSCPGATIEAAEDGVLRIEVGQALGGSCDAARYTLHSAINGQLAAPSLVDAG